MLVIIIWGFTLGVYDLEHGYDFGFGQVHTWKLKIIRLYYPQLIAIVPCIQPLYSVCKLLWKRRTKTWRNSGSIQLSSRSVSKV
jgi:hypothetical protein